MINRDMYYDDHTGSGVQTEPQPKAVTPVEPTYNPDTDDKIPMSVWALIVGAILSAAIYFFS